MSEFNYKEYLKNNPLLTEGKISKENSDKLINYFSNLDDEDLNDTLRDLSSWGHELITKERHDNPMADRMFTDFSSVTRWILSIDDDLAKDILYAIQNDLAMPVEKGQYINEDKKPKERNGMVWADEIDKWVTKEEYIEYLETRADDHFSEPLKEGFWTPQRATYPNRNKKPKTNVEGGLDSNAFSKIQAIADVYSYGEILDALESFYTKNDEIASGNMARKHAGEFRAYLDARTEIDESIINEELEVTEEDHSDLQASVLTLSNGETVEVNVVELMDNLVDNLDEPAMKLWNEFKDQI